MTQSLAPAFLLSMPQLMDPNFNRTVVLLCRHSTEEGAFGLVVNRPVLTSGRVVVNLDPPASTERELQVWVGGPVEPQRSWMLVGGDPRGPRFNQLAGNREGVVSVDLSGTAAPIVRSRPAAADAIGCGLFGMGPGSAGGRAPGVSVAAERGRSGSCFHYRPGPNVGDSDSPHWCRPCRATDVEGGALNLGTQWLSSSVARSLGNSVAKWLGKSGFSEQPINNERLLLSHRALSH